MAERDENFEEKENQPQESALEVTELDDQDLEDASGGFESQSQNTNCFEC
ncbi:MAG TPA: hypothetical protein VHC97_02550 [Thermoanaerobaculia bacterium]|jgi:hypothetical protein|nr:hypothetical protein [Thermoanaerobaculia bacterium]